MLEFRRVEHAAVRTSGKPRQAIPERVVKVGAVVVIQEEVVARVDHLHVRIVAKDLLKRLQSNMPCHIRRAIREAVKTWACPVKMPNLLWELQSCLSLDDTHDEDEDNWSRDLIDLIPAAPQSSDIRRNFAEEKEHLRSFLSKWYYPSDIQLLMDLAQMMYDGYTVSDLAKKHGLPIKRMKSIIADLRQKAQLLKLYKAYANVA